MPLRWKDYPRLSRWAQGDHKHPLRWKREKCHVRHVMSEWYTLKETQLAIAGFQDQRDHTPRMVTRQQRMEKQGIGLLFYLQEEHSPVSIVTLVQ